MGNWVKKDYEALIELVYNVEHKFQPKFECISDLPDGKYIS